MSRIDGLIQELCPDGVKFESLGEVGSFTRGSGIQKADLIEDGVGAIHYGQIHTHYRTWARETKSFVAPEMAVRLKLARTGDLVIATTSEDDEAVGKAVAWLGANEVAVSTDAYIFRHSLDPKYMAYFFQTDQFHLQKRRFITGTKVRRISGDNLAKVLIPAPPIEVQQEIVRVLDLFQSLEAELGAELEAELEARRRQYDHYRDSLLTFPGTVHWATLGEVAANLDSMRKPVSKAARVRGQYPYYGASGIVDYVDDYLFDGDYLLVSEDGANLLARSKPIAFSASGKIWVNNHAHVLEFDSYATRRLIEVYLNSIDISMYVGAAAQPKLTQKNLNRIRVPVPPLAEQERIVAILDKFGALVNDLSIGLPAELAARRQQYEYYRDRLLTFSERAA